MVEDDKSKSSGIVTSYDAMTDSGTTAIDPIENFKRFIAVFFKNPEFLNDILRQYVHENPDSVKAILDEELYSSNTTISYKDVDKSTAKSMIRTFVAENPGVLTSDIVEKVGIDPILTLEILKELKEDDSVLSESLE